jgi:hypothetical protein
VKKRRLFTVCAADIGREWRRFGDGDLVSVPSDVLKTALRKARREYVRVAEEQGTDPGPEDECWAEFEALADYGDRREGPKP